MADYQHTSQPLQQPAISPYASTSHNRGIGHGHLSLRRHSLFVTAPLLLVGVCAAIAFAFSGTASDSSLNDKVKTSNIPVTVNHDAQSQFAPDTPTVTTQNGASSTMSVSTDTTNGSTNTQVTVNGQPVQVPANGSYQQTVTNPDGSTSSYSVSNGSAGNGSYTSTNVSVNSSSYSSSSNNASGTVILNGVPYNY